jgi:hypothetical protein
MFYMNKISNMYNQLIDLHFLLSFLLTLNLIFSSHQLFVKTKLLTA